MNVGEIYVHDVPITLVTDLPERKVQAYSVAYGIMAALARDYTAPRSVKVQTPGKEHPDLMANYQYRFYVHIGDIITETYVSGEIVEDSAATSRTGEDLAIMIRRGVQHAIKPT